MIAPSLIPRLVAALLLVTLAGALAGASPSAARERTLLGVNVDDAPGDGAALDAYSALVGRSPALVMWYQTFGEPLFYRNDLEQVTRRGALPLITWDPQVGLRGIPLREISAGRHDAYLRTAAREAKSWPGLLYVRFAHEMNIPSSLWAPGINGNTPADFVAAWRHVVRVFRAEGVRNVQWVWCPNIDYGGKRFSALYPGDRWVDWVGLDGYNWGTFRGMLGWQSMAKLFGPSYDKLVKISHRPVMIAETGSVEQGGDKAAWIRQAFTRTLPRRLSRVRAVVWFERRKETDWRVSSSPEALAAYRDAATSSAYGGAERLPGSSLLPSGSPLSAPVQPSVTASYDFDLGAGTRVRHGRLAGLRVRCVGVIPAGGRCAGVATLRHTGAKAWVAGVVGFTVQAGADRPIHVALGRRGRSQLRRTGRLAVTASVRPVAALSAQPGVQRRIVLHR